MLRQDIDYSRENKEKDVQGKNQGDSSGVKFFRSKTTCSPLTFTKYPLLSYSNSSSLSTTEEEQTAPKTTSNYR